MSELNHVVLIGRITRDAETGHTTNNVPVCIFSIAHNRIRKENGKWAEYPHFFNFRLYGEKWKGISPRLTLGTLVSIEGHLEQDRWERKGIQRTLVRITVDHISLLGKGRGGAEPKPLSGDDETPLTLNDTGDFTVECDEERIEHEDCLET